MAKLGSDEVVHHINMNKLDNRPENLEVMTWDEHGELHRRESYQGSYSSDCSIWTLIKIGLFIVFFPWSLIVVFLLWFIDN